MKVIVKVRTVSGKTHKTVAKYKNKESEGILDEVDTFRNKVKELKSLDNLSMGNDLYFNTNNVESVNVKVIYSWWIRIIAYITKSDLRI